MRIITEREHIALCYMNDKMWSSAYIVGVEIVREMQGKGGSNYLAVGGRVLGRLRKDGFVTFLSDIGAWRITKLGREAVSHDIPMPRQDEG